VVGVLYTRELYLVLLSAGIAASYWINWFLRWLFMTAVPTSGCGGGAVFCVASTSPYNACGVAPFPTPPPLGATCGAPPLPECDACVACGMPALEPQLAAFTLASIGIFGMQFYSSHLRVYHLALLYTVFALVVYTHVYFTFNTVAQVVVGVVVGLGIAAIFNGFVFFAAYPYFDTMLRWPLVRYFHYNDRLCHAAEPVPGDPVPLVNPVVASGDAGETLQYRVDFADDDDDGDSASKRVE
jgi:hypothetical protein